MKVVIHNLLKGTNKSYEGDTATLARQLGAEYPWAALYAEGDLDHILWTIDHHSFFGVEIVDKALHPFMRD
jgi:hypothetical protein